MAVVTKKENDQKYKHLEQIYANQDAPKIVKKKSSKKVVLQKDNITISKKDLFTTLAVVVLLGVISVSGYLLTKI